MGTDTGSADAAGREDRALMAAALAAIAVATTLAPTRGIGADVRSLQPLLVAVPATFAATVAWSRGQRRTFAPPVALLAATAISGLLALVRGMPWMFNIGAAAFILGGWLPWPQWRTPAAARVVLWGLALAPIVVLVVAQLLGWASPVRALVLGGRIRSGTSATNLNAMSLLWSVLALEVLRDEASDRPRLAARVLQLVSLVLLGATGSRTMAVAAAGTLGVLVWRDRQLGWTGVLRRHGGWALYGLALLPRTLGRTFGSTDADDVLAGMSLSGRSGVWSTYIDQGGRFVPTGGGLGRPQAIAQDPVLSGLSTHNEYLWLAISVGILGVVLVYAGWFVALRARRDWVTAPASGVAGAGLPLAGDGAGRGSAARTDLRAALPDPAGRGCCRYGRSRCTRTRTSVASRMTAPSTTTAPPSTDAASPSSPSTSAEATDHPGGGEMVRSQWSGMALDCRHRVSS